MPDPRWDKRKALKTYGIRKWGIKYFDISQNGNVVVAPLKDKGGTIDLSAVVAEARRREIRLPLLVRFQDILRNRVMEVNESFRKSILDLGYKGRYQGVFPIKVNQLREVVEEILEAGEPYQFGLEAGSRSELLAAMALVSGPERLIICNGYKDPSFIRMALSGKRLGKRVILVVEKLSELREIIRVAKEMEIPPDIGVRVRLHARGLGRWESSSGDNAKFGLSTAELLTAVSLLRAEKWENCFQLLHFHIGSQVPDIRAVKRAVSEAACVYAKLRKSGLNVAYMDAGGGLGVDYTGSRSAHRSSTNYTLDEYTNGIVYAIQEVCNAENVPHPDIVTESGRAIVAHHAVLVVELFGAIEKGKLSEVARTEGGKEHRVVAELLDIRKNLPSINLLEAYHDAVELKERAESLFIHGYLSLEDKATVETLFWEICRDVAALRKPEDEGPEELEKVGANLCEQYVGNFSVFQSLLDHWAVGNLFPIMPIHRLNEFPGHAATLVDITCDSDGKICQFIDDKGGGRDTLALHDLRPGEPYYVGVFLVGAYQDIMGDLHNLFGRSNEIHCFLDASEPGGYYIEEVIPGSTAGQVLADVQYHQNELEKAMKEQIERAVKEGRLKPSEGVKLLDDYEAQMRAYTYLDINGAQTEVPPGPPLPSAPPEGNGAHGSAKVVPPPQKVGASV